MNGMAGHSKWAQIKRKKAVVDQQRGVLFTRHAQLIALAAKNGADPETNASLRSAIERAKEDNTPKTVIERAIQKGSGQLSGHLEEVVFDVFCWNGVVMLVEALTDNINRTRTQIHEIVIKADARIGERGSASWMFRHLGEITVNSALTEEQELALIEAGVQDIRHVDHTTILRTNVTAFGKVYSEVNRQNQQVVSAGLVFVPNERIHVDAEVYQRVKDLRERLESLSDIEAVYDNCAVSDVNA